jgi:hypothetical protein
MDEVVMVMLGPAYDARLLSRSLGVAAEDGGVGVLAWHILESLTTKAKRLLIAAWRRPSTECFGHGEPYSHH